MSTPGYELGGRDTGKPPATPQGLWFLVQRRDSDLRNSPRDEPPCSGTKTLPGFPKAAAVGSGHVLFNAQRETEMPDCRRLATALGHSWRSRCFRGSGGSEEAA